jgi:hypothetical protein
MVIGVVLATLLAACGSSGGGNGASSSEGKKYVNAMVTGFNKEKASDPSNPITRDQATCLSKKMVDAVGVDGLKKAGVTPQSLEGASGLDAMGKKLNTTQAKSIATAFFGGTCFDASKLLATQFQSEFTGQTKASIDCLAKEVLKLPQMQTALVDSILGKDSANPFSGSGANALLPAFTKCKIDVSKLGG